ncbi:hypothetical protein SAMN06264365_106156 [Actinoplanes regularis]|uniref:Uncharacterized protein n=1 Tax=Actinoplanes regularis TaxID=52697 RepID=A0A238ZPF5_9ACTN|nr:hypothetical protein Are01nite_40520 [Actinoplanes regularis]SNR84594.1 hypothetical protein SAMN06264365_106156 [Actinoplanes regularis]
MFTFTSLRVDHAFVTRADAGTATLGPGVTLAVTVTPGRRYDAPIPVLRAGRLRGRFAEVVVTTPGFRADPVTYGDTIAVRLRTV